MRSSNADIDMTPPVAEVQPAFERRQIERQRLAAALFSASVMATLPAFAAERTITFAVDNMTCASCPYIVKTSMAAVPGVSKVAVSLEAKTATVQVAEPLGTEFLLEYQKTLSQVMPQFAKAYGKYLGSGSGTVAGAINGKVVWDLYEDQDAPQLHITQFVGRITAADGSSIDFETVGYFVPRSGASTFWNLTSAVYFFSAQGPAFQSLQHALGVWEGDVDTRTYLHHYRLRLLEPPELTRQENPT